MILFLLLIPAIAATCCSTYTTPNTNQLTLTAISSSIRVNNQSYKTIIQIAPEFPASPVTRTGTSCSSRGPSANIWDCTGIVSGDVFTITFNLQRAVNNTVNNGRPMYTLAAFNEECTQKPTCPDTLEAMGVSVGKEETLYDLGPFGRRPLFVLILIVVVAVVAVLGVGYMVWRNRRGNPVTPNRRDDGMEKGGEGQLHVGWQRRPGQARDTSNEGESARGLIMDAVGSRDSQSDSDAGNPYQPPSKQGPVRSKSFDWDRIERKQRQQGPSTSGHKRQQSDGHISKPKVHEVPRMPTVPEQVKSRGYPSKQPAVTKSGSFKVKATGVGPRTRSIKDKDVELQDLSRKPSHKSETLVHFGKEDDVPPPLPTKANSVKRKQSSKAIPKSAQVLIKRPSRKSVKSKKSRPSSPVDSPKVPSESSEEEQVPLAMYTNDSARTIQDAILKWSEQVQSSPVTEYMDRPSSAYRQGSVLTDNDEMDVDSVRRQSTLLLDDIDTVEQSDDDQPLSVLSHSSLRRPPHMPPPLPTLYQSQ